MGINAIRGWARGDFNADGKIGFGDFQLMLDNWNPMGVHSPLTTLDGGAATAISAPTALADDAPATLSLVTTSAATISAATTANLTVPTAMPHRTQVASADPASPIATSPAQAAVVDLLSQSRAQMSATNRRQVVLGLAQRPWFRAGPPDQHAVTRKPALRHQTAGHSLAALESDRIDILSPVIAPVMVQS
jgi:hypothetical protein